MRWNLILTTLSAGCVAHTQGVVREDGAVAHLIEPDGRSTRLRLGPDSAPISALSGHLIQVDGVRSPAGLWVSDWGVAQGLHGMEVWVGTLASLGVKIGLQDRNSEMWYEVAAEDAGIFRDEVGRPVLIEGYVVGPHQIRVLSYRWLGP